MKSVAVIEDSPARELALELVTTNDGAIHAGKLALVLSITFAAADVAFEQLVQVMPMTDADPETLAWISDAQARLRAIGNRLSALPKDS